MIKIGSKILYVRGPIKAEMTFDREVCQIKILNPCQPKDMFSRLVSYEDQNLKIRTLPEVDSMFGITGRERVCSNDGLNTDSL